MAMIDKNKLLAELDAKSTNPNYRLNMRVIKALIKRQQEQESVIDRVRSEIESKITKRPGLNFTLRERERNDAFLEVLEIIDKTESEDKE